MEINFLLNYYFSNLKTKILCYVHKKNHMNKNQPQTKYIDRFILLILQNNKQKEYSLSKKQKKIKKKYFLNFFLSRQTFNIIFIFY